jgi:hypothetical protein
MRRLKSRPCGCLGKCFSDVEPVTGSRSTDALGFSARCTDTTDPVGDSRFELLTPSESKTDARTSADVIDRER